MKADDFFEALESKVSALKDMDSRHPLTKPMAVATLKRYLPNEKDRIRLHDLVLDEANRVAKMLFSDLGPDRKRPTITEYEDSISTLLSLLVTGGYFGEKHHRNLWLSCFQQLVTPRSGMLPGFQDPLDYYPSYLLFYAFGIASLAAGHSGNLAHVLARTSSVNRDGTKSSLWYSAIGSLRGDRMLQSELQEQGLVSRAHNLPVSRHLFKTLREPLRELIPADSQYDAEFRKFEFLTVLVFCDLNQKAHDGYFAIRGLYALDLAKVKEFEDEIDERGEKWSFLRAGLFGEVS